MIDHGTRLADRYALRERLGGGGAGDVWLAIDEALQRPVAVKVLRQVTPEEQQRFETEVRAQAPLAHPSIVRVFDVGTHERTPFLVMAHVQGQPLSAVLADGPLSAQRVARLGRQLADALAHAHAQGVIHRDVKPGNVLIDESGHAYLTDFGIARHQDSASVTAPGGFVGSAAYVAPEQAKGERVSAAADVYSLGLVLLQALTGRQEYTGTAIEAASARLYRAPHVPAELAPPWPRLLADMTAADPAARPRASEVVARLSQAPAPGGDDTTELAGDATTRLAASDERTQQHPASADGTDVLPPPGGGQDTVTATHRPGPARSRWRWAPAAAAAAVAVVLVAGAVLLSIDQPATTPGELGEPATLDQAMDRLQETIQP